MTKQKTLGKTDTIPPKVRYKKPVLASICFILCSVCLLLLAVLSGVDAYLELHDEIEITEQVKYVQWNCLGEIVAFSGAFLCFFVLAIMVLLNLKIPASILSIFAAFFAAGGLCDLGLYYFANTAENRDFLIEMFGFYSMEVGVYFLVLLLIGSFFVLALGARGQKGREGLSNGKWAITGMLLACSCPCLLGDALELAGSYKDLMFILTLVVKLLFFAYYLLGVNRFCAAVSQKKDEIPLEEDVSVKAVQGEVPAEEVKEEVLS